MLGRDLIAALEREGFTVKRRSMSYYWMARGTDVLLLDAEAEIPEKVAEQVLERARGSPGTET